MRNLMASYFTFVRAHSGALLVVGILICISSVITALLPWPLKLVVDHVLSDTPLPEQIGYLQPFLEGDNHIYVLLALVFAGFFLAALQQITNLVKRVVETGIAQSLTLGYGQVVLEHLQKLPLDYHDNANKGDLVKRVTSDTKCVEEFVLAVCMPLITSLISLLMMFTIMYNMHKGLTLIALCAAIPIPFLIRMLSPRMTEHTYTHQKSEGQLISVAEQTLTGLPMVQAFGQESRHNMSFRLLSEGTMKAYLNAIKSQLQFSVGVNLSTACGTAGMMLVGGLVVNAGYLSLGDLIIFLAYVSALYGPVETLAYISSIYASAKGRVLRVTEVLETEPDIVSTGTEIHLPDLKTGLSVEFSDVHFSYNAETPILNGLSLTINPGETVAFVGATGSGKSTLVSLIPRFFNLNKGSIYINGIDINSLDIDSLRSKISIVMQDPFLLPMSIADNIAYGIPDATLEDIKKAALTANAHEFIDRLPDQYDTVLSEQAGTSIQP